MNDPETYPNVASFQEALRLLRERYDRRLLLQATACETRILTLKLAFEDCMLAFEEEKLPEVAQNLKTRWPEAATT